MIRPILALARAEVLHVVRDRATLAQALIVPVVQLMILSNAATFQIRDTATYVVDFDRTSVSRGLVRRLAGSGHFRIVGQSASPDRANDALRAGTVTMVVTIPADFEATLLRARKAPVQLAVNAEKGTAAGIVQSYATDILRAYARDIGRGGHAAPVAGPVRIEVRTRAWYNPSLDYHHYMVPGIFVALVTIISTLLSAQNIAREKELGTLEQLNVTPITRAQFVTAKLLPLWLLALVDLGIALVVGHFLFGVPLRGSLALLFGSAGLYLLVTLATGLWISAVVETQQQAMFVAIFVLMVYLLLSGLFTPVDSMPRWVRLLAELNPVRHFVAISRAVLVRGAGLAEIARPLIMLLVFAPVVLALAVRQYAKRAA